jgi:hypothetical protein
VGRRGRNGLARLVWPTTAASRGQGPIAPVVSPRERESREETMAIISQGVLVLAIVWTLWQLVHAQRQVRSGAIVIPPFVAATLVFALCIVVVMLTGVSPLHLVWLFPCSFLVGIAVLLFPFGTHLLLRFLVLLAGSVEGSALPQPQAGRGSRVRRGRRNPGVSANAPRRTKACRRRRLR